MFSTKPFVLPTERYRFKAEFSSSSVVPTHYLIDDGLSCYFNPYLNGSTHRSKANANTWTSPSTLIHPYTFVKDNRITITMATKTDAPSFYEDVENLKKLCNFLLTGEGPRVREALLMEKRVLYLKGGLMQFNATKSTMRRFPFSSCSDCISVISSSTFSNVFCSPFDLLQVKNLLISSLNQRGGLSGRKICLGLRIEMTQLRFARNCANCSSF